MKWTPICTREWQQRIGEWFVGRFPRDTVLRDHPQPHHLPSRQKRLETASTWSTESFRRATGPEYDRLVDGNILDACSTNLFGDDITRSRQSGQKVARLAELSQKQLHEELTPEEKEEVRSLRSAMPSTPTGTTRDEAWCSD